MRRQASYNIMGKIYPLCPMDLIIIPPRYYHSINFFDNQFYERVLFNFDIDYADDEELAKLFAEPLIINIKNDKNISDLFDRFNEYRFLFTGEDFKAITHACCIELLMLLKLSELRRPEPMDIYRQCGFDSYTTFYREYKKFAGTIPSQEKDKNG